MDKSRPSIEMKSVNSSHIAEIGHDGEAMIIKYRSGATYHYDGVTEEKYKALLKRESVGKAWAAMRSNHPGRLVK